MNFKKIALTVAVIVSFIGYSLSMRHTNNPKITIAPATNSGGASGGSGTRSTNSGSSPATTTAYKDGTYTGDAADAFYGNIQVSVTIQSGKITDVQFLQYPNDRENSVMINQQAMPLLRQEAIQAQSAHVDGVTGATDSSQAFVQSLSSALSRAA